MDRVNRFIEKEMGSDWNRTLKKEKGKTTVAEEASSTATTKAPPLYVTAAFRYLTERNLKGSPAQSKFEVDAVARLMKAKKLADELEGGAAVYMAAVLDYLAAEVLDLAGDAAAADDNAHIIAPKHLKKAIAKDKELRALLESVAPMKVKKAVENKQETSTASSSADIGSASSAKRMKRPMSAEADDASSGASTLSKRVVKKRQRKDDHGTTDRLDSDSKEIS